MFCHVLVLGVLHVSYAQLEPEMPKILDTDTHLERLIKLRHTFNFNPPQNLTTVCDNLVFNRYCSHCQDNWHIRCSHYPHIPDDPRGNVFKTLSPDSGSKKDESYNSYEGSDDGSTHEESSDYETPSVNKEGKIYEETTEEEIKDDAEEIAKEKAEMEKEDPSETKKDPEVVLKAEDVAKMSERIKKEEEMKASGLMKNKTEDTLKLIREKVADQFGHQPAHIQTTTGSNVLKTVWIQNEEGGKFTILQEQYDDMNGILDLTVDNIHATLPREFTISQSGIPEVQLGVWAKCDLPKGVVFGPLRGRLTLATTSNEEAAEETDPKNAKNNNKDHIIRIYDPHSRVMLFQIDARSDTLGNWCRYINAARHISEQNCEVIIHNDEPCPMFRATKDIPANTEILTDYGPEFRKTKYLTLHNVIYHNPFLLSPLPRRKFECSKCGQDQESPLKVKPHRKSCNATKAAGSKKDKKAMKKKKKGNIDEDEDEDLGTTYDPETLRNMREKYKKGI